MLILPVQRRENEMDTDGGLRASIYAALSEANAPGGSIDDFDIDAIANEVHAVTGVWSLASIEHDDFWAIVRRHDKTQQAHYALMEDLSHIAVHRDPGTGLTVRAWCVTCNAGNPGGELIATNQTSLANLVRLSMQHITGERHTGVTKEETTDGSD